MALRTPLPVQPNMYMTDTAGRPLDGGNIYFGEVGKDSEFYPINVFYDKDLTVAASQPVTTKNGFIYFNGNTVGVYAESITYSVKVLDRHGKQVFYLPEMTRNEDFTQLVKAETERSKAETQQIKKDLAAKSQEIDSIDSKLVAAKAGLEVVDANLQDQINSIGGGSRAYLTYADMAAAASLPDNNPLKLPVNADIKVSNDPNPDKNGSYTYNGTSITKSDYDPQAVILSKVANAFSTFAIMSASGLPNGSTAVVHDDIVLKNNGYYKKDLGAWVKTKGDPYDSAVKKVNEVADFVSKSTNDPLDINTDKDGNVYRYTDANGDVYVVGLDDGKSLQSNINSLQSQAKKAPATKQDSYLSTFTDADDNIYAYFDDGSNLNLAGDLVRDGVSLSGYQDKVNHQVRYQSILQQRPPIKNLVAISEYDNVKDLISRQPSGIKTPTGMVYFYHKEVEGDGFDGDATGVVLRRAILSIDSNLNVTIVNDALFDAPSEPRGISKHPMVGRTTNGRIIVVFEKRLETIDKYTRYVCYSDDEGVTFTEKKLLNVSGNDPSVISPTDIRITGLGSTGAIVTCPSGRLLVPIYMINGTAWTMYSDDSGLTWTHGYPLSSGAGQEPSITLDVNSNVVMDLRPVNSTFRRNKAISYDEGLTWQLMTDIKPVISTSGQGTLFYDDSVGAMIQTHNETERAGVRNNYTLSVSFDNAKTFPLAYRPYDDDWYGGYSQIIKWRDGIYILLVEYNDRFTQVNYNENCGLIILSLSEVLSNVYSN